MDTTTYVIIGLVLALCLGLFIGLSKSKSSGRAQGALTDNDAAASGTSRAKLDSSQSPDSQSPALAAQPDARPVESVASTSRRRPSVPPPASLARGAEEAAPPSSGVLPAFADRRSTEMQRMRSGLARSRDEAGFFGRLKALISGRAELPPSLHAEIEEVLLSSDVGVTTAREIIERLEGELSRGQANDVSAVWAGLRAEARRILAVDGKAGPLKLTQRPTVVLFVGVNGAGKTTTIGKLAARFRAEGKTCVLAAGDTFRAAAVQQLTVWGQRVGCEVVRGKDGADPGSVIFDAIKRAQEIGADVVLADSAGRLHTKTNLMAEMQKIARTAAKALPGAPHEVLLVLDATNGQNAVAQAREFKESLELGGIVLTKLDGTAKGGVILGIADALKVPVRYVGLGERPDDLHEFVVDEFVEALLGKDG